MDIIRPEHPQLFALELGKIAELYFLYTLAPTNTNLFPKRQILESSKLKEFADNNFKFDENDRKFSKCVENTLGKGEIAHYEQFLLFPQCFQKTCTAHT